VLAWWHDCRAHVVAHAGMAGVRHLHHTGAVAQRPGSKEWVKGHRRHAVRGTASRSCCCDTIAFQSFKRCNEQPLSTFSGAIEPWYVQPVVLLLANQVQLGLKQRAQSEVLVCNVDEGGSNAATLRTHMCSAWKACRLINLTGSRDMRTDPPWTRFGSACLGSSEHKPMMQDVEEVVDV
jgi:hypothetical protein